MKKLTLRLEDVRVIGFEVVAPEAIGVGTVIGADALTRRTQCGESCLATCPDGGCLVAY
jgi:hypothetical protein